MNDSLTSEVIFKWCKFESRALRCLKSVKVRRYSYPSSNRKLNCVVKVARIVNYIQKHLVGKTVAKVKAQHDEIVFGKVGCSAEAFEQAMAGKKVLDARQQGKYFW